MPTFKNILCPVDFSPSAKHAATVATELAVASHGALTLVHIWQPPIGTPDIPTSGDVIQAMVDEADRNLAELVAAATDGGAQPVTGKVVTGAPWTEIVALVEAGGYDLVVMGTHGRTGISHALLGSVAERVVQHARTSVLVVR